MSVEKKLAWSLVRLELGRTPEFPEGSASRAYLLRLPLGPDFLIDANVLAHNPGMATVRRFWPNERDEMGYVFRKGKGWAFSFALGKHDDEGLYHLEPEPLRVGESVTVLERDGRRYPFRVVSCEVDRSVV